MPKPDNAFVNRQSVYTHSFYAYTSEDILSVNRFDGGVLWIYKH